MRGDSHQAMSSYAALLELVRQQVAAARSGDVESAIALMNARQRVRASESRILRKLRMTLTLERAGKHLGERADLDMRPAPVPRGDDGRRKRPLDGKGWIVPAHPARSPGRVELRDQVLDGRIRF